jgi:2',3'-cyclic-nucleotide 2'-phosphodiesterase (5'-nucleotidase family)
MVSSDQREWKARVLLLHSNDIHSRLEQAAKMASYIAEARRDFGGDSTLVVDIGDHMDRMRPETEGSDGGVNVALLNAAAYDAVTLGNNEGLTYPPDVLAKAYGEDAKFPVVCANLTESPDGSRPEWLSPSVILNKGGLRIGLIGVTAQFTDFYTLLGWDIGDPIAAAAEQARALRPHADVVVLLSHLGLSMDKRIAEETEGIDLILGGHTHHLLEEPLQVGGTTICAAGKFGEYIGRVEIGIDPITSRPCFRAACVAVAASAEQPEAAAIIGGFREAGERRMSRVVARLDTALPALAERESPLGNLLAAGLRRWTDAEIGIVNAGQLLGGLAAGGVTAAQIHALCPSPINPCRMLLAGRDLRLALEESLLGEFIQRQIRGFGFRGSVLGTLAVDGLRIAYDPDMPPYGKIVTLEAGGVPVDDERLYSVGTIDMFTFGIGYLSLGSGTEVQYYLPEFIRDVLARELRNGTAVAEAAQLRWTLASARNKPIKGPETAAF